MKTKLYAYRGWILFFGILIPDVAFLVTQFGWIFIPDLLFATAVAALITWPTMWLHRKVTGS